MQGNGLLLIANQGEDSISVHNGNTLDLMGKIFIKPSGNKLFNTGYYGKGPMVGPGCLYHYREKGHLIVLNVYDDSLTVIDLNGFTVVGTVFAGNHPYGVEVLDGIGRAFVTSYDSDSLSVIDLSELQLIGQIPCGIMPGPIALDRTTNQIYIANTGSNQISVIDAISLNKIFCAGLDGYPANLCLDPYVAKLYSITRHPEGQAQDSLVEYDIIMGKALRSIYLGPMAADLLMDGESKRIYVVDAIENCLKSINIEEFVIEETWDLGRMPVCLQTDRAGRYLYIACMSDNTLYVMDMSKGVIEGKIKTGLEPASILFID